MLFVTVSKLSSKKCGGRAGVTIDGCVPVPPENSDFHPEKVGVRLSLWLRGFGGWPGFRGLRNDF